VDYSKFDPPNETITVVNVGIDIKDIPKERERVGMKVSKY
jgi:hypothetical protein